MQIKSKCCNAEIVTGHDREYPTGGPGYINLSFPMCEACEEEHPETIEVCEHCGEEPDRRGFKKVDGDDWCYHCVNEEVDRRVKHLKAETGLAG